MIHGINSDEFCTKILNLFFLSHFAKPNEYELPMNIFPTYVLIKYNDNKISYYYKLNKIVKINQTINIENIKLSN